MTPDVRALRYFLAVAEEKSFTRAAERIGIAQPALSAQIRRLESQLGVALLTRTTRSVDLTPAGRAVFEEGPDAVAHLERVWDVARRVGRGEAGDARIGYSPSAGGDTLPRLVDAITARYPELRVTAEVLATPTITPAVVSGRLDAGITRSAQPGAGVRRFALRRERRGILVAAGHPLARRRRIGLATAARYPILLHGRTSNPAHHDEVQRLFQQAGLEAEFVEPPVALDTGQRMIRSGRVVGLVGESAVAAIPKGLRWVPINDPAAAVTTYLVLPSRRPSPVQRHIREVAGELARSEGWIAQH